MPILDEDMQRVIPNAAGRATLSQDELVRLAKQRDSAAWSEIYSQHYEAVYKYMVGRGQRNGLSTVSLFTPVLSDLRTP